MNQNVIPINERKLLQLVLSLCIVRFAKRISFLPIVGIDKGLFY